jgi:hypothetical protein
MTDGFLSKLNTEHGQYGLHLVISEIELSGARYNSILGVRPLPSKSFQNGNCKRDKFWYHSTNARATTRSQPLPFCPVPDIVPRRLGDV